MKYPLKCLYGPLAMLLWLCSAQAWDYEVHRLVNELAVASLPTNFPGFVRTPENVERIAFLSGEPDRWRNTPDLPLKHLNSPDHYIDIEDLHVYSLDPTNLPPLRYDFIALLAMKRSSNPTPWENLTEENNKDHTKELCGLLPWTISEYYSRLKSGFSYLKTYEENGGTAAEISNAQQNIVYVMGVMGHFVGDAAQPLHTTKHYNGWVGQNPNGYATNRGFHAWIDGGFWRKAGVPDVKQLQGELRTAHGVMDESRPVPADQMFQAVLSYIEKQHELVEPLYQSDKQGNLAAEGENAKKGKDLLERQVVVGAQMLGNLWVSAWQQAPEDNYLRRQLVSRQQN